MIGRRTHRYSHFPVIGCACHSCNYCRDKIGMADAPAEGTPELLHGFKTMTTTPDSRIAHDFGLGHIDTSTTATPDTTTTAGKIAVMRAYERGEACQVRPSWSISEQDWHELSAHTPEWRWGEYDYRIAPPPAPRTALQAARKHRSEWSGAHNPDSLHLEPLLREIDNSIVVTIEHFKFPHYSVGDPAKLTPGRYRLVRDDE